MCVCVCFSVCLLSVFLITSLSASSCWSADSHVFSRFVSSSPLLTPHSLPISQFLQTPHFSKSFFLPPSLLYSLLSSPLLSSPPTRNPSRNPLLQESFQQHYFHNTQQKTKQNQNQNQNQNKKQNQNQPTTETLDPDDAIHPYLPTQKKNYQNTQLPHPTPKNTQNKTKQNNTKTKPTHSKHKTFKQKQQQQQQQQHQQ